MPILADDGPLRDHVTPMAWTVAISSVGALAAQLQSNRKLTLRHVVGAVLTSGVAGLVVHTLLISRLHDDPWTLTGVSALAGIGGASTLDFLLQAIKARLGVPPRE